jgi:hypothetical protein
MPLPRLPLFAIVLTSALGFPPLLKAQQPPQRVTLAEFRALGWLSGQWRGSGGAYPAFFEEYRFLDDSTIVMRGFADSTFASATDSSRIVWRNGVISSRGSGTPSLAVDVRPTSVRFMREGASRGGYTFTRVSADQWTATLHPSTPEGTETVYVMRRVGR